jgi:hypothetical protein
MYLWRTRMLPDEVRACARESSAGLGERNAGTLQSAESSS